jgi:RHS repeat-associated protein
MEEILMYGYKKTQNGIRTTLSKQTIKNSFVRLMCAFFNLCLDSNRKKPSKYRGRQSGAAMSEFVVAVPTLLVLGLGGMQGALMYNAKNTVTYATFEAARKGAVTHAQAGPIQEELGIRIAPLFGGDGSAEKAATAIARGLLEANDPRYTKIEILNPTQEAFLDFGVENDDGIIEIPNTNLRYRNRQIESRSGVNIQDANLLKIRVTYAYKLGVPLMNKIIPAVLMRFDPDNAAYYILGRVPVTSVAMVRMQSAAQEGNNVSVNDGSGGGTVPGGEVPEGEGSTGGEDESGEDEADEGGSDTGGGSEDDDDSEEDDSLECMLNPLNCDDTSVGGNESCPVPSSESGGLGGTNSSPFPTQGSSSALSPTSSPLSVSSVNVENPINVVTGNKYQHEIDIPGQSGELGLFFERSYNSKMVQTAQGLGQGWRHTYQLKSYIHDSGDISIVQSDGRRVIFEPSEKEHTYKGRVLADGWLEVTSNPVATMLWHRLDGHRLQFNKEGLLVRIVGPSGSDLNLRYSNDNHLRQIKDGQGRQLTLEYYSNNRLKKVYDPAGNNLHYRYDEKGNLASVTNLAGGVKTYHYEDARYPHHLTGITDARNIRFATYAYDEKGRGILTEHAGGVGKATLVYENGQTRITNSKGEESIYLTENRKGIPLVTEIRGPGCSACDIGDITYTYNEQFQQTELRHKNGRISRKSYDDQNRLISLMNTTASAEVEGTKAKEVQFVYNDDSTHPSQVIRSSVNPQGKQITTLTYTVNGKVQSLTENGWKPDGEHYTAINRTTTLSYNDQNKLERIDGPRTDVEDITSLSYDQDGRLNELTGPTGQVQRIHAYDVYGRPLEIESYGQRTQLNYNERGQITRISRNQQTVAYEYSLTGQVTKITQPDGQIQTFDYDDASRRIASTDTEGNQLQSVFDTQGQLTKRSFRSADGGIFNTLSYLFDAQGRLEQLTKNGADFNVAYEDYNRLVSVTNSSGSGIQSNYNPLGQLISLTRSGITTSYEYDNRGALSGITDGRGNQTEYLRDDFGRIVTLQSPESGEQHYDYDNANNVTKHINANGDELNYHHDSINRLISATRPEGSYTLAYTGQSRLAQIDGPDEPTQYGYTPQGLLSHHTRIIDRHEFTTRYEYTANGQLTHKHLASGLTLRYHYYQSGAKIGQLKSVTQEGLFGQDAIIDELNSGSSTELRQTFGNGVVQTQRLNSKGQLIEIDHQDALKLKYQYNKTGQITAVDWQTNTGKHKDEYRYNPIGQLGAAITVRGEKAYRYDQSGNRVMAEGENKTHLALYKDDSNRIVGQAEDIIGDLVEHNAAGSPTAIGDRRYEYNSQQRPTKLYIDDQLTAEYRYNSWGERIKKTVYSGNQAKVTYYLYDGKKLVAEANENGEIIQQYLYYKQHPVSILKDGKIYAVHTDHLGTPRSVTDEDQQTVWSADYDPFGKAYTQEDPDQDGETFEFNLRFPGQYADIESGTHYNYQRDYDPSTGRYLTSDPIGQAGGLNTYLYAQGNPISIADPLGLAPGDSGGTSSDPLTNVSQPSATTGLNTSTGTAGDSPSGFVAEAGDFIAYYSVYIYNGIHCDGQPKTSEGEDAFNSGVDLFTTDKGQNVTTLHNMALGNITYSQMMNESLPPIGSSSAGFQNQNIQFSTREDGGCTLLFWYCSDQDREENQFADAPSAEVIEALSFGIGSVDFNYGYGADVLPENWSDNSGSMLVINANASQQDIRDELESLLGTKLVDEREFNGIIQSINATRDNNQTALVNLQPLYDKVLERFYEKLFSTPELAEAYDDYVIAERNFNSSEDYCAETMPGPGGTDICIPSETEVEWERAKSRYESLLLATRDHLIETGHYPRHDYDLEADNFRDSVLFEVGFAILTGDLSLVASGLKTAIKSAVNSVSRRLGVSSVGAKDAVVNALERFITKHQARFPPSTCSFDGDTLVKTDNGFSPIRDLRIGDSVWARDEYTGDMDFKAVLAQYSNAYKETVSVTIRDQETAVEQTIVSNRIHPYFVQLPSATGSVKSSEGHVYQGVITNGAWVDAADLQSGYRLLNDDGSWAEVVSVKVEAKVLQAFNLTVADYHTYFVSANEEAEPVWVHNLCINSDAAQLLRAKLTQQYGESATDDLMQMITSKTGFTHNKGTYWGYSDIILKDGELFVVGGQKAAGKLSPLSLDDFANGNIVAANAKRLPDLDSMPTKYHKITVGEVLTLRKAFPAVRKKYLQDFAETDMAKRHFTLLQRDKMAAGIMPEGYNLHHKTPLFRGGTNESSNLELLTEKFHSDYNKALHWYEEGANPYLNGKGPNLDLEVLP